MKASPNKSAGFKTCVVDIFCWPTKAMIHDEFLSSDDVANNISRFLLNVDHL